MQTPLDLLLAMIDQTRENGQCRFGWFHSYEMAAIYVHFLCKAGCAARIAEGDFSVVPQRNHSGRRFELVGVFLKTDSRKELFVSIDGQQGRDESIAHIRQQKMSLAST